MGESTTNLTVAVGADFDHIRSQTWSRRWCFNVLIKQIFKLPVEGFPSQLTNTTATGLIESVSGGRARTQQLVILDLG